MFFVDKYKPKNLKDAEKNGMFHLDKINFLKKISKEETIPHIIFYGPEGSGKKTLIYLFIELLYGKEIYDTRYVEYNVSGSGNTNTDVLIKQSKYHIELIPNNNNFDLHMIQDVIKTYVQRTNISFFEEKGKSFKIILIHNLDNLSFFAQTSLRRTIENYSKSCRFIMWARSLSKVIVPLCSRCIRLRIPSPNDSDMISRLFYICGNENIKIHLDDLRDIRTKSGGNIKKALWMLELYKNNNDYENKYILNIDQFKNLLKKSKGKITNKNTNIINKYYDEKTDILKFSQSEFDKLIEDFKMNKQIAEDEINNFIDNTKNYDNNYDKVLDVLIELILKLDLNKIYIITDILYSILITNINKNKILKDLLTKLLQNDRVPYQAKYMITKYGAIYNHNLTRCRREIMHIQGFIVKSMKLIYDHNQKKLMS